MKSIHTKEAPAAVGPYSQAIASGSLLFCSGQIAIDPATQAFIGGDVATQTRQILKNIDAVLHAAGIDKTSVVKTTIFMTDIADYAVINEIYADYFGDHKPARAAVAVAALPKGATVEIEAIAAIAPSAA